jgi:centromere protein X
MAPPTFKASLVEHVFRRVWLASGATEAAAGRRDWGSDNDSFSEQEEAADASPGAARVSKIHPDAVKLSAEFLRLFVLEALHRAQMEAMVDDSATVEPHHLEQVLAQLLLDF